MQDKDLVVEEPESTPDICAECGKNIDPNSVRMHVSVCNDCYLGEDWEL